MTGTTHPNRALFWAPRALSIVFIGFVSLFALDAFGEGQSLGRALADFAIHLVPSLAMAAALAIAWRWEWAGTLLFTLCGAFFLVIGRGMAVKVVFSAPCFMAACLFLMDWMQKQSRHGAAR